MPDPAAIGRNVIHAFARLESPRITPRLDSTDARMEPSRRQHQFDQPAVVDSAA